MTAQSMDPVSVDEALGSQDLASEQTVLLDLIDTIQFARLDNVKLPQIIAVGDQSAGKSSVLEAITGIPFPRHADACTRFPTEIRLRRAKEESSSVFILPDQKTRTVAEQDRLRRFHATIDTSNSFGDVMDRAVHEIAPRNIPGRFAAADILVIEKRGPTQPLLTVVDLPGLVRIPNKAQSLEDLAAIEEITNRYMRSSRAIILTVVGGNIDYTQAPVLKKARDFDPAGERTIGVLTKPDLTQRVGLEEKFIELVNNQDKYYRFDLGWYVLLNPSPRDPGQDWPSIEERKQAEESFFTAGRWSTLPREMCGAMALKQKLSVQLLRHIGKYLPKLQKEIQREYDKCVAELKRLGTGRDTIHEMKEELHQRCSQSKELVNLAVRGMYTNPAGISFFPKHVDPNGTPPQNLRARAVEENWRFAERVRQYGLTKRSTLNSDLHVSGTNEGTTNQDFARNELELYIQQNTGIELATDHNPLLVYKVFRGDSESWATLAQEHKDTMGVICNEHLGEVIAELWPRAMQEPLRRELIDPQMKQLLEEAQDELGILIQDLSFEVQPYTHEYEQRLKKWRTEQPADRPYSRAEELEQKVLIYYELSVKMFVQNVITQVVERHLLRGLRDIFDGLHIHNMRDEVVEAIAAENKETRDSRKALKAKKTTLEESRHICASLALRKDLRPVGRVGLNDEDEDSDEENLRGRQASERLQPDSPLRRKRVGEQQTPGVSPQPSQKSHQTPRMSPRPSPDEERRQSASHTPEPSPVPYVDPRYGWPVSSGSIPIQPDRPPKIQVDSQSIPGGWDSAQPAGGYDAYSMPGTSNGPGHPPPPPPPRPGMANGNFQPDVQQFSPSQDPRSRPSPNAYPSLDPNFTRISLNGGNPSPPRSSKKFFPFKP